MLNQAELNFYGFNPDNIIARAQQTKTTIKSNTKKSLNYGIFSMQLFWRITNNEKNFRYFRN